MPSSGKNYEKNCMMCLWENIMPNSTHSVGAVFINKASNSEVLGIWGDNHSTMNVMTNYQYPSIILLWSIRVPKPYA